ncbi:MULTISPECIES: hypothetical protein [unclassified Microcoleus]|uniref:hypothetical protein n=1 Tax=unclassified Microcoleus TaxID=2642155 RepID=UPI002FD0AAE5
MKRTIYYRGFIINNHEKEQGLVIITPAQTKIWIKDAVNFDQCKQWVDDKIAKWAIEQAFKA